MWTIGILAVLLVVVLALVLQRRGSGSSLTEDAHGAVGAAQAIARRGQAGPGS